MINYSKFSLEMSEWHKHKLEKEKQLMQKTSLKMEISQMDEQVEQVEQVDEQVEQVKQVEQVEQQVIEQVEQVEVVVENTKFDRRGWTSLIELPDVHSKRKWVFEQMIKLGAIRIQMYEKVLENNVDHYNTLRNLNDILDQLLKEFE